MTTSQTLTLVLAVWGALLSTGLGLWTIIRDRREDGQLRIRVWVGRATRSNKSVSPFCSFDVVNVGRRKVYFGGVILHDGKGGYIDQVLGPGEPGAYMTLEPGEVCENDPPDAPNFCHRHTTRTHVYATLARVENAPPDSQHSGGAAADRCERTYAGVVKIAAPKGGPSRNSPL